MFTICLQFVHTLFTSALYNALKDKGKEIYKKWKREVIINGRTFTLKKAKVELCPQFAMRDLRECYKKPSIAKQSIYEDWLEWYMKEDNNFILKHFSVNSYNVNMFTLRCDVYSMCNEFLGHIYISKTRQEFWTM